MPWPFITLVRLFASADQIKSAAAAESIQLKNFKIISIRQNIQLAGFISSQVSGSVGATDAAIAVELASPDLFRVVPVALPAPKV